MMEPLPLEDISDREEGEIVEDGLEDVSDCSLTSGSPINAGKSVSHPEILNGVCLSRARKHLVHDKSIVYYGNSKRHRRKRHSQNGVKISDTNNHRRTSFIEILSDSEDDTIDPCYAKQLRSALCRESKESSTTNSLKTRLKALIDNSHSDDEENLNDLRDLALLSTLKPLHSDNDNQLSTKDKEMSDFNHCEITEVVDPELQELRLEALKSVILKNHERRKRKAVEILDDTKTSDVVTDINKENNQDISNKKLKIEDGESVSISETMLPLETSEPKTSSIENIETLEEDADILRAVLLASISKNLSTKPIESKLKGPFDIPKVVVKPLIINVSADSDSDTEIVEHTPPKNAIKSTVSEFLRRQRAEVEANVKKKGNTTPISNHSKYSELMKKSVVKLLPRSQQLEYHKLKQQLLNAHKRVKTRKLSYKNLQNNKKENAVINSTRKVPLYKTTTSLTNNNRIPSNTSNTKKHSETKSDPTTNHLHTTLNDLQFTKNGRLQMKGKYRSLGPLLNQINKASCERQQHEILIKKLLQDIQIARTELANSHQNFTSLVQQLVKQKHAIDQGIQQLSAPIAPPVSSSKVNDEEEKTVSATEIKSIETVPEAVVNDSEGPKLQELNDITKIFVKEFTDIDNIPKYKSPLNYSDNITDPVTAICPYDLLGVCKDKECPYVHYS